MGLSVDSVPCLSAWAESLGGISYPLLSDFYPHGEVTQRYGVLRSEGYSERAIFVVDKKGLIRYVDVHDIGQQPDNEVLFEFLLGLASPEVKQRVEAATSQPGGTLDEKGDQVILYCTPWCPDCRRARDFLKNNGVEYTEIDISRDRNAAKRVRGWANGNETTPTFDLRGTIQVGYDRLRLAKTLGLDELSLR